MDKAPASSSHKKIKGTLAIIAEVGLYHNNGHTFIHWSFGRIIDALAKRYDRVIVCAPTSFIHSKGFNDYELKADNIELIPQPSYASSLAALKCPAPIVRSYINTLRQADHIFMRGMLPYVGIFYLLARIYNRKPVHWIVGDPVALLRSHRRSKLIKDMLSLLYAYQDRMFTRIGHKLANGAFICNGNELASIYSSSRTYPVVSSTITEDEFFIREDTCQEDTIRILFIGFVRPEKGVEYLVDAIPKLEFNKNWQLTIIGPWERYEEYKQRLDKRINELGIGDNIKWEGYVSYGPHLWEYLRSHDIFVLPTLSEGTPRVLVEARANSLPIVATKVGGIPSSITDGVDGILVPSKDSAALAEAINKIVANRNLRRGLIQNGLQSVRKLTIEQFVKTVISEL